MNTVTITRSYDKNVTFGNLTAKRNGMTFSCKTLELKWLDNKQNVSCIPEGEYICKYTFSSKFFRYLYEVTKVLGRSGIRFHAGNYAFKKIGLPDIQGCILLGATFSDINKDGTLDISNSSATTRAFESFMGKESFVLTIKKSATI